MTNKSAAPSKFAPEANYLSTQQAIGYVSLSQASTADYQRIGFKSGLEVHQQLNTAKKLFCRCPAGIYQADDDYDAEIIRHMRPTLSEMGEYDGTALMEFKTRKEITYRINNQTACTYEVDDTPPFPINRQALDYALEIALLCRMSIVGEVHITRKQYLDGSIPTGFQRTAILGMGGQLQLQHKTIDLIQLSIEEDACREVSDIGHKRIYKTDRLGMPLVEIVTQPQCLTPNELRETSDYIRFLTRSSGKVRKGMGAARQDTNVSCQGGTRIEIKGVSHGRWLPLLSHNEAFRQWALLHIRQTLLQRVPQPEQWAMRHLEVDPATTPLLHPLAQSHASQGFKLIAIALPYFHDILSHFTQPGCCFLNELEDRLKVIACVERPNISSDEALQDPLSQADTQVLRQMLQASAHEGLVLIWALPADVPTALEVVDERCRMAFEGVPRETRQPLANGTTRFERVLPGADRMYPDTDSAPIPLDNDYIDKLSAQTKVDIHQNLNTLIQMGIPADTYTYLLRNNLTETISRIGRLGFPTRFVGTLLGHDLKHLEGKTPPPNNFKYSQIVDMFAYIASKKLHHSIAKLMLPVLYRYPHMDFDLILSFLHFKRNTMETLMQPVDRLIAQFKEIRHDRTGRHEIVAGWVMGRLHHQALGNVEPKLLYLNILERCEA